MVISASMLARSLREGSGIDLFVADDLQVLLIPRIIVEKIVKNLLVCGM